MEDWACWQRASWEEAAKRGGRKPIQTRWVDVNKGDSSSPDARSSLVAKDFAATKDDSFFVLIEYVFWIKRYFSTTTGTIDNVLRNSVSGGVATESLDDF